MKQLGLGMIIVMLLLELSGMTACAADEYDSDDLIRFQQKEFAIVAFNEPPEGTDWDARFKELADAHFNVVLLMGDEDALLKKLDLCAKFGMMGMPMLARSLEAIYDKTTTIEEVDQLLIDHPACLGYGVSDEPGVPDFPALVPKVEFIRKHRPGKLALINLFPSYASPWGQLGAESYEEYVRLYMEQVDVDVLCMDHYPLFRPGEPDTRDAYCADLEVMRRHSLKKGIPFWNCFNIMPYGPHTDPTEDQIRWQMHASVAYGVKGLIYFCYWTPTFRAPDGYFEFPKGGAVIHADGRPGRHYEQAMRLNFGLKNLGPTLMQLTSTDVVRITPEDEPAEKLSRSPLRDLQRSDYDPRHNMLVGMFKHTDGRDAVFIMNYHFAYTAWPTVVFEADIAQVREVCQRTGSEIPVIDDSPEMEGTQISLDAGQGRLFLIPLQES